MAYRSIQIQHLLLFNISYGCAYFRTPIIQIQHLLLFNGNSDFKSYFACEFKYNTCYYSTEIAEGKNDEAYVFKYNTCYYSTTYRIPMVQQQCNSNTTPVTIQLEGDHTWRGAIIHSNTTPVTIQQYPWLLIRLFLSIQIQHLLLFNPRSKIGRPADVNIQIQHLLLFNVDSRFYKDFS